MSNDYLILVSGKSASGKSASLRNLKDHNTILYANCESGKKLPFKNKFKYNLTITNPNQISQVFAKANEDDEIKVVIFDTLTFLLDMYVSQFVRNAPDGRAAWGDFAEYFRNMMQQQVATCKKTVIFLAHTLDVYNEATLNMESYVPVPGSLKNQGVEAWFSLVVSTKKIRIDDELKDNALMTITPRERAVGYKHVFQTQITKETTGERIRGPMGMFEEDEIYMDNDLQLLIDRLHNYYTA